jgi:hypothetical protein
MAREAAECRETWQALGKLDDRIASETPSLQIRSAFQEQLADVVQRERARRVDWFPFGWIFARAPGIRAGALAAAILVTIAALALWRPVVRSLRESAGKEEVASASAPSLRSAASRLSAVLAGGTAGPAAAGELSRALESDSNPNVRLAALDALSESQTDIGLEGRIARALAKESDPLVRLEMIRTIGERRLLRDAVILRDLSRDPRLDDLARDEIARVMTRLGS